MAIFRSLGCDPFQPIIIWMRLGLRCWDVRTKTSGFLSLFLSAVFFTVSILYPSLNVSAYESVYLSSGQRRESQPRLRNKAMLKYTPAFYFIQNESFFLITPKWGSARPKHFHLFCHIHEFSLQTKQISLGRGKKPVWKLFCKKNRKHGCHGRIINFYSNLH